MIYNIIDEKGRFIGLKFDNKKGMQEDSHTYSYLSAREICRQLGEIMGLDSICEDYLTETTKGKVNGT